jgi:hypothetical protein
VALAEATVGIAMGGGTDVALETADITMMTSDLSRLTEAFGIAKRCYRIIIFTFWGTIMVDSLGIGLAFFGLLAPAIAALIHVGSELARSFSTQLDCSGPLFVHRICITKHDHLDRDHDILNMRIIADHTHSGLGQVVRVRTLTARICNWESRLTSR